MTELSDRNNVDSVSAAQAVFDNVKGRIPDMMCDALRDFMKEEIDKGIAEELQKVIDTERVSMIKNLMGTLGLTAKEIMDAMSIPAAEQERYAQSL
ncbi:MAG: hypothetical protein IJ708_08995 [Clostridia bacterium]|nr:hypothetical protein [Clostridia bacterium]